MGRNLVRKTFTTDGSVTIPAGVTTARVLAIKRAQPIVPCSGGFLDSYGKLYMMGFNNSGQLGVGDSTPRSSPTLVVGGLQFIQCWSYGDEGSNELFGLSQSGLLYSWGGNGFGGGGTNDTTPRSSPTLVVGGITFMALGRGNNTGTNGSGSYGITTNGKLYAWGNNQQGQLGVGDVNQRSSPTLVVGGLTVLGIHAFGRSILTLTTAGQLYAWGINQNGQLGVGDTTVRSSPTLVVGGLAFQNFYSGGANTSTAQSAFGITTAGQIYSWGFNTNGELGVGDSTPRSSPTLVVGGLTFQAIQNIPNSASSSTLGLTTSGAAYSWGANAKGQLGDGSTTNRSSPVAVVGGLVFSQIFMARTSASNGCAFGLTSAGVLYAWGDNTDGELGVGDTTARSSPTLVVGGLNFVSVFSGVDSSAQLTSILAVTATGQLYSWGFNSNGQLGVGDVTPRSSPTLVVGPMNIANVKDKIETNSIPVTPGTTYSISMKNFYATFGTTPIGSGLVDQVIVEYLA